MYAFKSIKISKNGSERIDVLFLEDSYSAELYAALVAYKKKFGDEVDSVFLIGEEGRCVLKEKIELRLERQRYVEFLEIISEKRTELSFEASSELNEKMITGAEIRLKGKMGSKWAPSAEEIIKTLNEI